ncbi:thiamine transporter 1 [Amia ocellicauda]|uniref:thiamine transporter 1 n=1 Tax=Amia ocellicauda TaxID=2972642 RepID=UPI003464E469
MEAFRRFRSSWQFPTALMCVYGFFSMVKPLEPFLIPYLTGPDKNLTTQQVGNEILPVWTYSYLIILLPVFLATDYLRYKPVIILQVLSLITTTTMLLWADGVLAMQFMEFFYGVVTATEIAYFSYIYSVVDLERYQKVTSYCRSIQLAGYTVGSVLGQFLVTFEAMSFYNILIMTLVLSCIALIASFFLPMPEKSMFFHRKNCITPEGNGQIQLPEDTDKTTAQKTGGNDLGGSTSASVVHENTGFVSILKQLWFDFLKCYTAKQLIYWSLWWILSTCGYYQVGNYIQVLWEDKKPSQNFTLYNGGVEAAAHLFGTATTYAVGFMGTDWTVWGELTLGLFSGLGAAALLLMSLTDSIWICYAGYIVFKGLYMLLITIAMFQIAAHLSMERYALVFGANTFGALILQTLVTAIVVDSRGLRLDIVSQFIIYGSYFGVIAAIFVIRGIYTVVSARRKRKSVLPETIAIPDENGLHKDVLLSHKF